MNNLHDLLEHDLLRNAYASKKTKLFLWYLRHKQCHYSGIIWKFKNVFLEFVNIFLISSISCDISTNCKIGGGLRLPHLLGIVISKHAIIGNNCTIFHNVTIGANEHLNDFVNSPQIGNNVYIGAGAIIIGPIKIGDNVIIGANAVVTKDVACNMMVVGTNKQLFHESERKGVI